jgi:hypothetical protein
MYSSTTHDQVNAASTATTRGCAWLGTLSAAELGNQSRIVFPSTWIIFTRSMRGAYIAGVERTSSSRSVRDCCFSRLLLRGLRACLARPAAYLILISLKYFWTCNVSVVCFVRDAPMSSLCQACKKRACVAHVQYHLSIDPLHN